MTHLRNHDIDKRRARTIDKLAIILLLVLSLPISLIGLRISLAADSERACCSTAHVGVRWACRQCYGTCSIDIDSDIVIQFRIECHVIDIAGNVVQCHDIVIVSID